MGARIRPARLADREAVVSFASDTFEWGDYVPEGFENWLQDGSMVLVAETDAGVVAVARAALVSATELWMSGARVHPEHRRRGIATALGRRLIQWGREHGALVARLVVESGNEAARRQVAAVGLRPVSTFARVSRSVGSEGPALSGNGGRRAPSAIDLRRAPAIEAEAAFLSWSTSSLGKEARGLFAVGWTWRRLNPDDLRAAAAGGALWSGGGCWAVAAVESEALEVVWCEVTEERAGDLARALLDIARDEDAGNVRGMIPETEWLRGAFERAGYDVEAFIVYAMGL